jgi:hypothetical protein
MVGVIVVQPLIGSGVCCIGLTAGGRGA